MNTATFVLFMVVLAVPSVVCWLVCRRLGLNSDEPRQHREGSF